MIANAKARAISAWQRGRCDGICSRDNLSAHVDGIESTRTRRPEGCAAPDGRMIRNVCVLESTHTYTVICRSTPCVRTESAPVRERDVQFQVTTPLCW